MPTPCFMLNKTNLVQERLRRFCLSDHNCAVFNAYHNQMAIIGNREAKPNDISGDIHPHDDSRWPTQCQCGYVFTDKDQWQLLLLPLFQRSDNGELTTLQDAPPGAMWYATWLEDDENKKGPDGHCLIVRLPTKDDWMVDSRASNCGSPCINCGVPYRDHPKKCNLHLGSGVAVSTRYVDSNPGHRCWVRNGEPPNITVDKNGNTCDAGGGSIAVPGYHGFLRDGVLTDG